MRDSARPGTNHALDWTSSQARGSKPGVGTSRLPSVRPVSVVLSSGQRLRPSSSALELGAGNFRVDFPILFNVLGSLAKGDSHLDWSLFEDPTRCQMASIAFALLYNLHPQRESETHQQLLILLCDSDKSQSQHTTLQSTCGQFPRTSASTRTIPITD